MKAYMHNAVLLVGCVLGLTAGCDTLPRSCDTGTCGTGNCGTGSGGCESGKCGLVAAGSKKCDLYDRCYPERYNDLAQRSVNHATAPQILNGHVLDQTVWNAHFETGTDKLNPAGQAHLQYLARRRPCPDKNVYLATSLDLTYDPGCPDRFCGAKQELDTLRVAAVQKYLAALNCGRPQDFTVLIHDPAEPGIHSGGPSRSIPQMYSRFRGGLLTGGGGAAGGGAAGGGTGGR